MSERDGFFFYRSFWDAVDLLPAKDQLPILKAVISFGLDGKEPDKLTPTQNAIFLLTKPVLVKGRNKAESGKKGGSKRKANSKQTESKTESASGLLLSEEQQESNPIGLRQGINDERVTGSTRSPEELFLIFWNAYPKQVDEAGARAAWMRLSPGEKDFAIIMQRLEAWKQSKRWADAEFIPKAENFLNPEREYLFTSPSPAKQPVPKGTSGELGTAELEAIQKVLGEEVSG